MEKTMTRQGMTHDPSATRSKGERDTAIVLVSDIQDEARRIVSLLSREEQRHVLAPDVLLHLNQVSEELFSLRTGLEGSLKELITLGDIQDIQEQ